MKIRTLGFATALLLGVSLLSAGCAGEAQLQVEKTPPPASPTIAAPTTPAAVPSAVPTPPSRAEVVEVLDVLFAALCSSEAAFAARPRGLPDVLADEGPIAYLRHIEQLSMAGISFGSEAGRAEFYREEKAKRQQFLADFWAHAKPGARTRASIQALIDGLDLQSNFENLVAGTAHPCEAISHYGYVLLRQLQTRPSQ